MEQPERDQRIAAMIEPELRQEIEDLALAEDRSMSSVIRTLLREALEARSVSVAARLHQKAPRSETEGRFQRWLSIKGS